MPGWKWRPALKPGAISTTAVTAKNMAWTPKAGSTDLAGNALASIATWTETDVDQDF